MQSLYLLNLLILFIIQLPTVLLIAVFYLGTQLFCRIEAQWFCRPVSEVQYYIMTTAVTTGLTL